VERRHILQDEPTRVSLGAVDVPLDIEADTLVALCKEAFRPAPETTVEIDAKRFHAMM
jgi:hypothetical protein